MKNDTAPVNWLSSSGTNNANFYDYYRTGNGGYTDPTNYLTPVGYFAASPGPYGTYDMGGDVFQWDETDFSGSYRGMRGGSWDSDSDALGCSNRDYDYPTDESYNVGFRVASVPEPGSITLLLVAAGGLLIWRVRRK